jgi:hypothetical protein
LIDDSGEFKETIALLELANIQLINFRILDKKLAEKIGMLEQHSEPDMGSFFRISIHEKYNQDPQPEHA